MLRTYTRLENETVKVGKLAQVVDDKITTRFPLIQKGFNLKASIPTSYEAGKGVLCKIGENNIVTAIDNVLNLSQYKEGNFSELSTTTLTSDVKVQKMIELRNNKFVALYNTRSKTGCYLFRVNTLNNTIETIDEIVISSMFGNFRMDIELISENKVAISYLEEISTWESNPCFIVIRVDGAGIEMLQEPKKLDVEISSHANLYVTKINKDTFIGTYCTLSSGTKVTTVHSVIFEVGSTDELTNATTLKYRGYYSDFNERYVKPVCLADNKVIIFEFKNNFSFDIVLREVYKNLTTGVYTFNTISTLKAVSDNPHYVHNVDLLRVKEDGSKDFIMFNRQIVHIDANNTTLTEVDSFPLLLRGDSNTEIVPTIKLDNNSLLYLHENNFKIYSYIESDGNVIGVIKNSDGENYSVILAGLVENIVGVDFVAGKSIYYDELGNLSHDDTGTYLGYATSNSSFIIRPDMLNTPKIIRADGEGYLHNNKYYYHGFIPYIDEDIINGQTYYLDDLGKLTTTKTKIKIGVGLSKGLYINRVGDII